MANCEKDYRRWSRCTHALTQKSVLSVSKLWHESGYLNISNRRRFPIYGGKTRTINPEVRGRLDTPPGQDISETLRVSHPTRGELV